MASSYHRLDSWIPPRQEATFFDDDPDATLGEDSVGDGPQDAEKGLHTTGVARPPARMRTCYRASSPLSPRPARAHDEVVLCRLSAIPVVLILLLIALLADPKPLTSKLPSRVQPYVDRIADRLRPSVEGGFWSDALYNMTSPACPRPADGEAGHLTRPYDGEPMPRTALAAYPGSEDGYARELVERATGYRTSSAYCDEQLRSTFLGECDQGNSSFWLKKTHYPGLV